ncbi:hypothetical protein DSO57_1030803 [Entomophthora muscae]|uniref:Uncharacterized protein n=1 Tax=Entomophthora muscae TaxID=34485 RepID=A0ACC2TMZ5_9FUNG|nr:hypothetical protein DSO57_1030803 [Entomophthora muscae]
MAKRNLNSTKTIHSEKKAKKAPTKEKSSGLGEEAKSNKPQPEKLSKPKTGVEEDIVKMAALYYESIHHKESQLFTTRQKSQLENLKLLSKANNDFPTETSLASADKFLFRNSEAKNSIDFSAGVGKDFLSYVMTWKLLRGKFRPRLLNLVGENTEESVKKVTRDCFNQLQASLEDYEGLSKPGESFISVNKPTILKLIKDLSVLRGVGPATASGNFFIIIELKTTWQQC